MILIQRDLPSAWEDEATRRAKGLNLALSEHYEGHVESVRAECEKMQCEIERDNRNLQVFQRVVLATLVETQDVIHDAEKKAMNAARDAQDIVRRIDERVKRIETDKALMSSRIRQFDADKISLQKLVRAAEQKADRCLTKVEAMRKRAPSSVEIPPGTSISSLWLDKGGLVLIVLAAFGLHDRFAHLLLSHLHYVKILYLLLLLSFIESGVGSTKCLH
ncbi:hypothetical protein Vi05172_g6139 [Venturia inaequalis]|nr:hypothetical protein Vi05172_g6139 [Venturia inaequalis]